MAGCDYSQDHHCAEMETEKEKPSSSKKMETEKPPGNEMVVKTIRQERMNENARLFFPRSNKNKEKRVVRKMARRLGKESPKKTRRRRRERPPKKWQNRNRINETAVHNKSGRSAKEHSHQEDSD